MATPSGNPAWARTADVETYGGASTKVNYQSQGATNPRTDVTAEEYSRLAADLAAVVRACPFSTVTFTPDDTTPDDPTVTSVDSMNGVTSVSYPGDAAPTGFPVVTRVSDGVYDVTYPASVTDDYGVSQAVDIKSAAPNTQTSTVARPGYVITSATTVRVYVTDATGTGVPNIPVSLSVWT